MIEATITLWTTSDPLDVWYAEYNSGSVSLIGTDKDDDEAIKSCKEKVKEHYKTDNIKFKIEYQRDDDPYAPFALW